MTEPDQSDVDRYWIEQLDAGHAFIERVLAHPIDDDCEPLVDIEQAAHRAGVELVCSTRPHAAGRRRIFLVRAGLIEPLLAAAADVRTIDHTLLIEDAFRTRAMQRDLALSGPVLEPLVAMLRRAEPKADVETMIRRLAVIVAARPKCAGHMAGAAVDVNVLGADGSTIDVGGGYLTVSEKMPMDSPFVSDEVARNRRFVSELMQRHGFTPYPFEFWHYSCDDVLDRVARDDPHPARYGPVDVLDGGRVAVVADQLMPLHDQAELARHLLGEVAQR